MTRRLEAMGQADYAGLTNDKHFNGKMRCLPHKLNMPFKWKKPKRVFVNSMSDLFHEDVPDEFIDRVFAVMYQAQWHQYQVLTKRAERMHAYMTAGHRVEAIGTAAFALATEMEPKKAAILLNEDFVNDVDCSWPLRQVWLGVSAERQKEADERIPWLLKTPAAVRFVSAEPLLGPISLFQSGMKINGKLNVENGERAFLHWVIVGGESGRDARPMHPDWARQIRNDCCTAGVRFFFKQWGEWAPLAECNGIMAHSGKGKSLESITVNGRTTMFSRAGKKASGRLLDGIEWDEFPAPAAT